MTIGLTRAQEDKMIKVVTILIFGLSLIFAQPMTVQPNEPFCSDCINQGQMMEKPDESSGPGLTNQGPMMDRPDEPFGPEYMNKEPREKLETIRIWQLTNALDLTEEQGTRLFPKLKDIRQARDSFERTRMKAINNLEEYLRDSKKFSNEIKNKLQEIELNEAKFRETEAKLRKEIASILTPEQQAKFMLFQMRFDNEMRQLIHKARNMPQERMKREQGQRPARRWRFW